MSPSLTLYRGNGACSLVPHILLRELSIPFSSFLMTFTPNGFEGADNNLPRSEYLKINPSGYVPALRVNDSEIITELPAIVTYIASLAPEREVLGRDPLESAKVHSWLCWLSGTLHGYGYAMILRPGRFTDNEDAYPGVVAKGRKIIEDCHTRIEAVLEDEHAIGGRLTVVDINLYVFWRWGQKHDFAMRKHYPKYGRLAQAIERMESTKAALKEEQLPLQFQ